jgi:hypothetical protein
MELGILLLQAGTDDMDWGTAAIASTSVAFFFAAVIVVAWQVGASWRARISAAREESYRKLVEDAVAWQRQATVALERMTAELTELRARTAEVERVLKEVG